MISLVVTLIKLIYFDLSPHRFQILRDLIPHGDQKRDTASFLLEVIDYVQLLQEKVQKYEGSYQGWSTEPTKLMPWGVCYLPGRRYWLSLAHVAYRKFYLKQRHSHWRVQSFLGSSQAIKNSPSTASTFSGKFDERTFSTNPSANVQTPVDMDSGHDTFRALDQQSELAEKTIPISIPFPAHMPTAIRGDGDDSHIPKRLTSDALSAPCPSCDDQHEEHSIEGGTISVSSAYSHGVNFHWRTVLFDGLSFMDYHTL
ncbi:Transcription factor BIM2 [Bienertia sinuspersici]